MNSVATGHSLHDISSCAGVDPVMGRTKRIVEVDRRSRRFPSLRATGSRECAPDDRLREAIHGGASGRMDCFVALLLAMPVASGPYAFFARIKSENRLNR